MLTVPAVIWPVGLISLFLASPRGPGHSEGGELFLFTLPPYREGKRERRECGMCHVAGGDAFGFSFSSATTVLQKIRSCLILIYPFHQILGTSSPRTHCNKSHSFTNYNPSSTIQTGSNHNNNKTPPPPPGRSTNSPKPIRHSFSPLSLHYINQVSTSTP